MQGTQRRPVLSVIGDGGTLAPEVRNLCLELGERAVDAGFRVACGGLGGVMEAVSEGAHRSKFYREGDTVGLLPSYDRDTANPWIDVVIPTGMQIARNVLVVAMADVVIAVAGGAGTLSEMALAWQLGKPIVGLTLSGGWAADLGGRAIDDRFDTIIHLAQNPEEAIKKALELLRETRREPGEVGSGWKRRR